MCPRSPCCPWATSSQKTRRKRTLNCPIPQRSVQGGGYQVGGRAGVESVSRTPKPGIEHFQPRLRCLATGPASLDPEALARATLVREQYGLALNRDDQGENAEDVLLTLINERGPSSETYGILGRVYKDRYEAAGKAGNQILARGMLDKAIEAYVKGLESDWRDAYPGINAVQLMELREPPDPRRAELLPVVTYSVKRRIESKQPDYWDYATLLELALLDNNEQNAMNALSSALAADPKGWQVQSTLDTVRRLRRVREARGTLPAWITQIERDLEEAARTNQSR